MKVRMTAWISGTRDGEDWPKPPAILDLPKDEAEQYIARGLAEEITKGDERAVAPVAEEKAVRNAPRRGLTKKDMG